MSTERLIEIVLRYPEIYDKNHTDFRKIRKKTKLWKTIANELGRCSADQTRRRWKNLRDTYIRVLKSCSEEGAGGKRWLWSDRMERFRPFLARAPRAAALSAREIGRQSPELTADSEDSPHEEEAAPEPEPEATRRSPTPSHQELITCDVEVSAETTLVPKQEPDRSLQEPPPPPEEVHVPPAAKKRAVLAPVEQQLPVIAYLDSRAGGDEVDSLFLAYAMTVKKFSPRRQAMTKLKMAQVIAEEELAHVDETEILAGQACNHATLP